MSWLPPGIIWKMAAADPDRARRLVDEAQGYRDHPQAYLYFALGATSRDPRAAEDAFQKAMRGIDRLMNDRTRFTGLNGAYAFPLPTAEQIDPALVPELFWRALAARPPEGNPSLPMILAWYDRDVARALFEAIRPRLEQIDDHELGLPPADVPGPMLVFLRSLRAMVAWLEKLPLARRSSRPGADDYRLMVSAEYPGPSPRSTCPKRFWQLL